MRFKILRSSDPYVSFNEIPPCKNAVIVEEQEPIFDRIRDENNKWRINHGILYYWIIWNNDHSASDRYFGS